MDKNTKADLKADLEVILLWCLSDLQSMDEITPNVDMLKARIRVARSALRKIKKKA